MTIVKKRAGLDEALSRPGATLLIVFGAAETVAGKVHEQAQDDIREPWREIVWIQDLDAILEPHEIEKWGAAKDTYVVLGGMPPRKKVAARGVTADLLNSDRKPDKDLIRMAFQEGDLVE